MVRFLAFFSGKEAEMRSFLKKERETFSVSEYGKRSVCCNEEG
jgi:hypothetical protein